MAQLTFGSLFAGIGGIDLGFERAGMRCLWQVEKDAYCRRVLAKHWPNVERFEDVKNVGREQLKPVDVIAGGFPCQPHSVAGKRKGAADDRNLWPEHLRIITELKPAYVVCENVPGIITTYLDTVLSDLESAGYAVATFNLPACGFDAPHKRERIFVVAYAEHQRRDNRINRNGSRDQVHRGVASQNNRRQRRLRSDACKNGHSLANANGAGRQELNASTVATGTGHGSRRTVEAGRKWATESGICRISNGVPNRVDRLRSLGNAVVPQVAEFVGRLVVQHSKLF